MGGDNPELPIFFLFEWFQSTPPHGGRPVQDGRNPRTSMVSIHAPAWGATGVQVPLAAPLFRFQSTPPHGGRRWDYAKSISDKEFQSTPPHGGRRKTPSFKIAFGEFQSTPPHGGRLHADNSMILHCFSLYLCVASIFVYQKQVQSFHLIHFLFIFQRTDSRASLPGNS